MRPRGRFAPTPQSAATPASTSAGVTRGIAGAIAGGSNPAVTLNGTSTGLVGSGNTFSNPQTFSGELWFKTTTTSGGRLIGFGTAQTGNSTGYDRHVYMTNAGKLRVRRLTGSA
jgi:hypothetical protein